jgi:peptidoglycan/LPS O-acetylase OafA/YrhL
VPRGNGRIAAVDGLRGVAVGLVIIGHLSVEKFHVSRPVASVLGPLAYPQLGVLIFFVLSGYLITSILVRERMDTGRISVSRFYARRALRIWPAFYAFLLTVGILSALDVIDVSAGELMASAAFLWNYWFGGDNWWLGHTWSLALEEQFYLLWPLVLLKTRPVTAAKVAAIVVLAAPMVRLGTVIFTPGLRSHVNLMLHTRADSLMAGALIALLPVAYPVLWTRVRELATRRYTSPLAIGLILLSAAAHPWGNAWPLLVGFTVETLAVSAVLVAVLDRRGFARSLAWRPLVGLGVISYSAYLWQQLFLGSQTTGLLGLAPIAVLVTLTAAAASRRFVEVPFLRLKRRYEVVDGPATT